MKHDLKIKLRNHKMQRGKKGYKLERKYTGSKGMTERNFEQKHGHPNSLSKQSEYIQLK